jgi:hypothetical protein
MLFTDPADTLTLQLPTGWALDIGSAAPTLLVFSEWYGPANHNLFVRLMRTQAAGTVRGWVAAVRGTLPPDVVSVQVTDIRTPTVWVARPGREGRPDQRWAIVRGSVLDMVLEDVGVPLGGLMRTPVLELAVDTLAVPANGGPGRTAGRHLERAHGRGRRTDGTARYRGGAGQVCYAIPRSAGCRHHP